MEFRLIGVSGSGLCLGLIGFRGSGLGLIGLIRVKGFRRA